MSFFTGKAFLVTGASSGIGKAIAKALVDAGAKVALMARSADTLNALCAEWGTLATPGDVTREEDCRQAVEATIAAFGKLDGVVHSAGVSMRGQVLQTKPEVFRRLMDINFHSCVSLAQAAVPALEATRGHFVVISSVVGKFAPPNRGGYAASKHAVQAFMDALRIEVLDKQVHVLTVCPGWVATNISVNALTGDGGRYDINDPETAGGLDPAAVARDVLDAIRDRKREIAPAGPLESLGLLLARFAPGILDQILLRRVHRRR